MAHQDISAGLTDFAINHLQLNGEVIEHGADTRITNPAHQIGTDYFYESVDKQIIIIRNTRENQTTSGLITAKRKDILELSLEYIHQLELKNELDF